MREIICMARGAGKTTTLLKRCAENDGQILCSTITEKKLLKEKAKSLGLKINEPVTYSEFMGRNQDQKLYIDNADHMLYRLLAERGIPTINIDTMTCSTID